MNQFFTRRPVPILVINLERDADRMAETRDAFSQAAKFELIRSPGVLADLPRTVAQVLTHGRHVQKGTLGTFMAHVLAWETIADGDSTTVVVEDDARPAGLHRVLNAPVPDDCELLFINHRMTGAVTDRGELGVEPAHTALARRLPLGASRAAPGGDGYILSVEGARKLLSAVAQDGFGGHVDWRLLRYGITRADVEAVGRGTWMMDHPGLSARPKAPQWKVVNAYRVTQPLIRMREAQASSRKDISGIEQTDRPTDNQAGG